MSEPERKSSIKKSVKKFFKKLKPGESSKSPHDDGSLSPADVRPGGSGSTETEESVIGSPSIQTPTPKGPLPTPAAAAPASYSKRSAPSMQRPMDPADGDSFTEDNLPSSGQVEDLLSPEQMNMTGPFADLLHADAKASCKLFQDTSKETEGSKPADDKVTMESAAAAVEEKARTMATELIAAAMDWKTGALRSLGAVQRLATFAVGGGKKGAPVVISVEDILCLVFFLGIVWNTLLFAWARPSVLGLILPWLFGLGLGLALCFFTQRNRRTKHEVHQMLNTNLGINGLHKLVGRVPHWINFTDKEKVEWLNSLIAQLWPYYDIAVCAMVKETVESMLVDMIKDGLIPGVKKMGFKQLSLGDAPLRVESVYVDPSSEELWIESLVRWGGDATVVLYIEMLPKGINIAGEATQMCPKVYNMSFVGTMRIALKPLIDGIPGFGALVATFRKSPRIKYDIDFGNALGGTYVANLVKPVIRNLVDQNVAAQLVWPSRQVVPILGETPEQKLAIMSLYMRHHGVLKVTLVKVSHLPKTDLVSGKCDPMVEMSSDSEHWVSSSIKHRKLEATYNETFHLLVQEPLDQELKVEVSDSELFKAGDLVKLKFKKALTNSKDMVGRALVQLAPVCKQEPEPFNKVYELGDEDWSYGDGPGKGKGRVELTMQYRSFISMRPSELAKTEEGTLIVEVFSGSGLGASKNKELAVYVKFSLGEGHHFKSPLCRSRTNTHDFMSARTAFYNTKRNAVLKVKVCEDIPLLGSVLGGGGAMVDGGMELGADIVGGGAEMGANIVGGGIKMGGDVLGGGVKVGGDLLQGGKQLGTDVFGGGKQVLSGDVLAGGKAMGGGVANTGKHLGTGGLHVVGDVLSGGKHAVQNLLHIGKHHHEKEAAHDPDAPEQQPHGGKQLDDKTGEELNKAMDGDGEALVDVVKKAGGAGNLLGKDREIGRFMLSVEDIAKARDYLPMSGHKECGLMLRSHTLQSDLPGAHLFMLIRYAPDF